MTKAQLVQTAVLTAIILVVVLVLDFLVNVVAMPGVTPYTPLMTALIALMVTPAAIAYLIRQNAKVQRAQAALAEERLARLAADGANAAKSQFLANMSHELRTPLNAIIGYSEIIAEDAVEPAIASDSQRIQSSARHLLGLINDILDHVKLEAGELRLAQAQTELALVFAEVVDCVRATAAQNGNVIETDCAVDIGVAWVDERRLKQCMLNLASNAAKFTSNGVIRFAMRGDGEEAFVFEARDTGAGIAEKDRARLFDPFMQADASVTRAHGGTGLGLAITKRLIDAMGGSIHVESEPGVGSVFTLRIPRRAERDNVVTLAA